MDAELLALDAAMASASARGWQVVAVDEADGVWFAAAGLPMPYEEHIRATGTTRQAALEALVAAL